MIAGGDPARAGAMNIHSGYTVTGESVPDRSNLVRAIPLL
jgi:hypothetical protein